ncbi:MAG: hypothetical protein PHW04_13040 [Candidatus Wallbacteria bacterium]|nr:hypothetical protein [Candidatus Wallbacteria bacterium]
MGGISKGGENPPFDCILNAFRRGQVGFGEKLWKNDQTPISQKTTCPNLILLRYGHFFYFNILSNV